MNRIFKILLIVLLIMFFVGCRSKADYVGSWQTDLFSQGNVREQGSTFAVELYSGGIWSGLASMFAEELHWNVTLELRADGTAVMDSGMEFFATWYQEGDHIVIEGDNIYGTAKLSSDGKILYFKNIISEEPEVNGVTIGRNYIEFEFERLEE